MLRFMLFYYRVYSYGVARVGRFRGFFAYQNGLVFRRLAIAQFGFHIFLIFQ